MLVWICSTCPFSPNNHVFFLMRYPNQKKCQDDSDSFQKAFLVLSVAVWGGRNLKNLPRRTTACSWILSIPQISCVIHLPSYWLSGVHHQETEVSETNSTWHWQNRHCVAPTSDRGALNMKERVVSVASDESKAYCEENSGVWNSGSKNCDGTSQIRSSNAALLVPIFYNLVLEFWPPVVGDTCELFWVFVALAKMEAWKKKLSGECPQRYLIERTCQRNGSHQTHNFSASFGWIDGIGISLIEVQGCLHGPFCARCTRSISQQAWAVAGWLRDCCWLCSRS